MKALYTLLLLFVSFTALAQYEVVETKETLLAGQTHTVKEFTEGTLIRKSVMKHQQPFRVLIYPNPATAYIQLDAQEVVSYTLLDLSGRTVRKGKASYQEKINVESVPEGMYFLRVSGVSGTTTQKLMVRR